MSSMNRDISSTKMTTIRVTISERPLGIRFGHFYNNKKQMLVGIHEIMPGSHGSQIGLLPGDTLNSLNDSCILSLSSAKALQYFRKQPLPFIAIFDRCLQSEKYQKEYNSDEENEETINNYSPYNTPISHSNSNHSIELNAYLSPISTNSNNNSPFLTPVSTNSNNSPFPNLYNDNESNSMSFPSIDDSNNICYSLGSVKNSNNFSYHNEQNQHSDLYYGTSETIVVRPFYELAEKLLVPKLKIPMPISPAVANINDFVMIDEEYEKNEHEYDELYQKYNTKIDMDTKYLVNGYIRNHCLNKNESHSEKTDDLFIAMLTANYLYNNVVLFDERTEKYCDDCENIKVTTTSSNGFKYGIHEWQIRLLKCDIYRQEIGIIEKNDKLNNIITQKGGIGATNEFGARALYGNVLFQNKYYYASYNENGKVRCKKGINQKIGWCTGDIIKVVLNLTRGSVQFYLNDKKVRKTISIQKNKEYHPIISFSGNCQYELLNFS